MNSSAPNIICSRWTRFEAGRGEIAEGAGVTRDKLMQALQQVRGSQRVTDQNPEGKYQTLEKYGRDLTEHGAAGEDRSGHRPR